jgi:alkylation response protein AidB-like acyl-CoA dehydrogenase
MTGPDHRLGADWLVRETDAAAILTPERLTEEHRLVGQTAAEFMANEVLPAMEALERKEWDEGRRLLRACGELGLLGVDSPERVGGIGMDKAASVVVVEAIGASAAFSTMFGAQTSLALIPILCFGTPDQQSRYLPRLLSGEIVGAYCLSESGSGSDALGLRTRATREADGTWRLNGEKMWTTNGGFADLFIVFAKADEDRVTAFIVERGFHGVSPGQEEHKMGLHGSSTTPLLLADARVPAENLLGEVGTGHRIAFNVLNYGRFKLSAMCSGGAKAAIAEAARYASSRRQFGRPIASFGAIQHKLGEMAIRAWVVESMIYRTAGLIDEAIGTAHDDSNVVAAALEEFAAEASLLKVASSEMMDFVVDENVQIHGGNGFVRDYEAERRFRDARVNRIFEGTNEINRLLVPARLIKRSARGGPNLIEAAGRLIEATATPPPAVATGPDALGDARMAAAGLKATALMLLGLAARTYGEGMAEAQEVTMGVTDAVLDAFGAESAVLRADAAAAAGHPLSSLQQDAACVAAHDAVQRVRRIATDVAAAMHETPSIDRAAAAIERHLTVHRFDVIAARRRVAASVIERQRYPFA